jgi:hypothetical protein
VMAQEGYHAALQLRRSEFYREPQLTQPMCQPTTRE